jgi:CRP-like cAMP-binding protein
VISGEKAKIFLRHNGWLSRTSTEFCDVVCQRSHVKKLHAGNILFLAGDEPRGLFGLVTGGLGAFIAPDNTLPAFAHLFHPGSWLGEIPALTGCHHVVGTQATRESTILHLPAQALNEILVANPEYWKFLGQLAATHVEISITAIADLMRRDNKQRLAAIILRLAGSRIAGEPLAEHEVHVSQEDIAAISNLARTTVISILNQLEKAGLIERSYRRLRISNPDGMRALIKN